MQLRYLTQQAVQRVRVRLWMDVRTEQRWDTHTMQAADLPSNSQVSFIENLIYLSWSSSFFLLFAFFIYQQLSEITLYSCINVSANTLGFILYEYYYSRWILDMYEECFEWWLHVSFGLEQRFISHRLHNIYLLIRSQLPICLPCEFHSDEISIKDLNFNFKKWW